MEDSRLSPDPVVPIRGTCWLGPPSGSQEPEGILKEGGVEGGVEGMCESPLRKPLEFVTCFVSSATCPHCPQKRSSGDTNAPQDLQCCIVASPKQNAYSVVFSICSTIIFYEDAGHTMIESVSRHTHFLYIIKLYSFQQYILLCQDVS